MGTFFHRHKGFTPYLLLAPGILWLAIFFLIPLGFLGYESLQSGLFPDFQFTWEFSNFSNGIRDYHEQIVRSFMYAGIATVACLLLAYPLVYWIAFRAGPWRNLFLLFIVAPFFVTYLVRTLAWLNILADEGPVVGILRGIHVLGPDGRLLATSFAVVSGITYNFLPFMALPIYVSLEQIDPRLLEAAKDLYASPTQAFLRVTLPLSAPGIVAGTLLTFIPAAGDFINAALLGTPGAGDDRERHPVQVPGVARLPERSVSLVHPHGADPRHAADLRAGRGLGEAHRMTTVAVSPPRARPGLAARAWRFVKRHALTVYAVLVVGYLMLPIAVVILFSFNKPAGRFNYVWEEFTFDNWVHWNAVLGIQDAIITSLEVGLARDSRGDRARHAHRHGDRPTPLRRTRSDERARLSADGDA